MQRHERRLRVLYLTNIPAPYRVAFLNELAAYCDLTVLYERRTARDRDAAWSSRGPRRFREIHLRGVRTAADAAFCPGVLRHLRRTAFDIVVVGMYSTPTAMLAIAALRALGIPFLLSTDGGRVRPEGWARRTLKRSLISSATAWLSTGNQTSRYLTHYGAVADRIHRYPFSSVHAADVLEVPTTREVKRSRRAELGITERQCVLAVGQFIHRKGFDILIRAAALLPSDVGVYVVGGEPTAEYLHLRRDVGARNVRFVGFVSDSDLRRYYDAADVFALPTRQDNWGLVVNEAMARGLPVVTTDRCIAGREMVDEGVNGFIVPADDAEALAQALLQALAPEAGLRMARAALATAHEYTIEAMAAAHIDAFERTGADRHSRGMGPDNPPE